MFFKLDNHYVTYNEGKDMTFAENGADAFNNGKLMPVPNIIMNASGQMREEVCSVLPLSA